MRPLPLPCHAMPYQPEPITMHTITGTSYQFACLLLLMLGNGAGLCIVAQLAVQPLIDHALTAHAQRVTMRNRLRS